MHWTWLTYGVQCTHKRHRLYRVNDMQSGLSRARGEVTWPVTSSKWRRGDHSTLASTSSSAAVTQIRRCDPPPGHYRDSNRIHVEPNIANIDPALVRFNKLYRIPRLGTLAVSTEICNINFGVLMRENSTREFAYYAKKIVHCQYQIRKPLRPTEHARHVKS